MSKFFVKKDGTKHTHKEGREFLRDVEALVRYKQVPDFLSIPKGAVSVFRDLQEILKRNNIKVDVTEDSDPEAIDYVLNGILGGVIGATSGAALGGAAVAFATQAGRFVPYVGWIISGTAVAGAALGTILALQVTRMGLRIKFSKINPGAVDLEFLPAAPIASAAG